MHFPDQRVIGMREFDPNFVALLAGYYAGEAEGVVCVLICSGSIDCYKASSWGHAIGVSFSCH